MANETEPAFVTRRELYPILGIVYLLIASALLGLIPLRDQHILLVIGYFLLFVTAMGLSVFFTILGIRERRRATAAP
jgi:hypothetical protein